MFLVKAFTKQDAKLPSHMIGTLEQMHGFKGNANWAPPRIVAHSEESNRADQGNNIKATEYMDEEEVLEEKIQMLVELIKQSKRCCAYTGAGLSRAAGIGDYASKAKNSITAAVPKLKSPLDAQPTYSHRVLTALEREGYLHYYVQQNHDGLPQKAGFPQEKINEIHGAWYDPSNPVVQFSESLRHDFFEWMLDIEQQTDLCLCLGTSLSGMNADRVAKTPARKSLEGQALGTIIINLQETKLDDKTCIRIWAPLDDVFASVAEKLELDLTPQPVALPPCKEKLKFVVPYNRQGAYDPTCKMIWNLNPGEPVICLNPNASNYKAEGEVVGIRKDGNLNIGLGRTRHCFGVWWVTSAVQGSWKFHLPFVNIDPVFLDENDQPIVAAPKATIQHECLEIAENTYSWEVSLTANKPEVIKKVTWRLLSEAPSKVVCNAPPFAVPGSGSEEFPIKVTIYLTDSRKIRATHKLSFSSPSITSVKLKKNSFSYF